MVILFTLISCILVILMICGIFRMSGFSIKTRPLIQALYMLGIIAMVFNTLSVCITDRFQAALYYGLYLAVTDWLAIVLLLYAQRYTGTGFEVQPVKCIVYIAAGLDTISMVINAWTGHVFVMKWSSIHGIDHCYSKYDMTAVYMVHEVLVHIVLLMVILTFLYKVIHSVPVYRIRYLCILLCLGLVITANFGYVFFDMTLDLSSILYVCMSFIIAFFSLYHIPKGMIASILDSSIKELNDGIVCFDSENRCIYCNNRGADFFNVQGPGNSADEKFRRWLDGRDASAIDTFTWNNEVKEDGGSSMYEITYYPIFDKKQHYIGCYFHTHDITDSYNSLKRERFRATHDSVTGCLNRNGFFERVRKAIDEEPDVRRYMIVSDIRNFKLVNELFGTDTGDSILIRTSELLRQYMDGASIYGRLTADRFAICMKKTDFDIHIFDRITNELSDMAHNSVYSMHTHIGIYEIVDNSMEITVMCDRAILAIQKSKDDLENIVCYYDEGMSREIREQGYLLTEFEKAIEDGQFRMYLQPQVSTAGHILLGAEALVRWVHPDRGMISPGEFIPVFENTGIIYRLDRYIWECACRQLKTWKDAGREELHISVNISPKDFYYIDIYKTFTGLVEKYGIDPSRLKLELTETAMMNNIVIQKDVLEKLHRYGFCIEIDDFGSGYSSLNTLKDLMVDVIKIDMGFLGETMHSDRSRIILNSVMAMSKQLGLVTVTEGVETQAQIDYLTGIGCDIIQGYYFSKPVPADEFEEKYSIMGDRE